MIRRRKRVFGDHHPDLGFSYLEVGSLYELNDKRFEATNAMRKGFGVIEHALGATHPRTLLAATRLSLQLACNDLASEARDMLAAVEPEIKALKRRTGSLHPDYPKYIRLCRTALKN